MQWSHAVVLIAGIGTLSACHDDLLGLHGCPTEYFGSWHAYGLSLEHVDPGSCPRFLAGPGTWLTTGADVVDGGYHDFRGSLLFVTTGSGAFLARDVQFFSIRAGNRSVASHSVLYEAGREGMTPDVAIFELNLFGGGPAPYAEMTITYTDDVLASVSGPSLSHASETGTWTASVTQGVAPFTYRWYRDWELVGTDQSYTDQVGAESVELRLDVTDSRGYAASVTHFVYVNDCPGTEIQC